MKKTLKESELKQIIGGRAMIDERNAGWSYTSIVINNIKKWLHL